MFVRPHSVLVSTSSIVNMLQLARLMMQRTPDPELDPDLSQEVVEVRVKIKRSNIYKGICFLKNDFRR